MKTKILVKTFLFAVLFGVVISGCKKDEQEDLDTTSSSDNALAEATFNDVKNIADQAEQGSLTTYRMSESTSFLTHCATITRNDTVNPKVLTIDFGSSNCEGHDQRNRRGKIIVTYTGAYRDSGSTHTITFDNYYVNDNKVEGSKTVTNTGRNSAGNLTYSISVSGSIILANGKGTITWTSNRTREWVAGESTLLNWTDDAYLIRGSASGTSAAGVAYSANISTALRVQLNCRYIVSGVFDITPSGKVTRSINYGNGTCDAQATVTINGNVYNITLR